MDSSPLRKAALGFLTAIEGAYHVSGMLASMPGLKETAPRLHDATTRFHAALSEARKAAVDILEEAKVFDAKKV